jgi:predicted nuclease with TOPRIM domain
MDYTEQVLAALARLDSKIDGIKESLAQQRAGIASLETWRGSVQEQQARLREEHAELEKRVRTVEEFTAGQKVYAAVAAVVCSAVVSGIVGLIFHWVRA